MILFSGALIVCLLLGILRSFRLKKTKHHSASEKIKDGVYEGFGIGWILFLVLLWISIVTNVPGGIGGCC